MRYDIAIIGTGPAGLSAAVNAKNRNKNILIFGKKNLSDKIISAHEINNYLGMYGMTGREVFEAFKNHMKDILEYRTMEYYRRRYESNT